MREEYQTALQELEQAEQNFQYADLAYIDTATYQLNAAQAKVDLILKEMKG